MQKIFLSSLMLLLTNFYGFGQNDQLSKPLFKNFVMHFDGGCGVQLFDPSALKASLAANNYGSDLSSNLFMINYCAGVVFKDKFSLGVNLETGTTTDFKNSSTTVGLAKFGASGKVGYDIWTKKNNRISLFYQLGVDVNTLNLTDATSSDPDFNDALDQRTSHTLFSGNVAHRFSSRYDYSLRDKPFENGITSPALGIEIGYSLAGKNSWEDVTNGPEIDNSGFFVSLIYSARVKKFKTVKK
jgi:hypothetical protein